MRRWQWAVMCLALASPAVLLVAADAFDDAAFLLAVGTNALSLFITAGAMAVAARRGDPRLRTARRWFAVALLASAAGSIVVALHAAVVDRVPTVSPANLAPLVWVPCALAGLFSIPSEQHREGGRLRAALDGVVVTAALAMLFWVLFLAPVYRLSDRSALEKAVLLGYPIVEFLLAVTAFTVAAHARGDVRRFLRLMTAGLMLAAVADAGSAAAVAEDVSGFDWTYVVTQAGLSVMLCGALMPTATGLVERRTRVARVVDAALPHAPLVFAVVVVTVQSFMGRPVDLVVVSLGALLVLGLVARQALYAAHLGAVAHRLSVVATRDSLTGMATRSACLVALETALAERRPGDVAVALFDLDGFKEVNDTFGHAAGDATLADFASRLASAVGDSGVAARLGGDEFAVLVVGDDAERRGVRCAQLVSALPPSAPGGPTVPVAASAGVAGGRAGDTTSTILRRADLALYEAKRSAVRAPVVFSDELATRAERRHLLAQALPGAAARGELEVVYQPVFRLDDLTVIAAEALLRWHSPVHGRVSPAEFVPLAEETHAIDELGAFVLRTAVAQLSAWRATGRALRRLSVNVSPRQLVDGFPDTARRLVDESGVAPSSVTLEITESAMPDLPANRCVERLRAVGFPIAMDDFGAGFSSLAQLAVLPVDVLKFDREFVRSIATPSGRRIVQAVISLAAELGLTTVAEGVETQAELDVVREAGCALAQGYYLAGPLTAADMTALLDTAAAPLPRPRTAENAAARTH